eukprot:4556850-Amphidinium_carterae.1
MPWQNANCTTFACHGGGFRDGGARLSHDECSRRDIRCLACPCHAHVWGETAGMLFSMVCALLAFGQTACASSMEKKCCSSQRTMHVVPSVRARSRCHRKFSATVECHALVVCKMQLRVG